MDLTSRLTTLEKNSSIKELGSKIYKTMTAPIKKVARGIYHIAYGQYTEDDRMKFLNDTD